MVCFSESWSLWPLWQFLSSQLTAASPLAPNLRRQLSEQWSETWSDWFGFSVIVFSCPFALGRIMSHTSLSFPLRNSWTNWRQGSATITVSNHKWNQYFETMKLKFLKARRTHGPQSPSSYLTMSGGPMWVRMVSVVSHEHTLTGLMWGDDVAFSSPSQGLLVHTATIQHPHREY